MREFNFRFRDGLLHGLRPSDRVPLNGQSLVELYNFKAGKLGIEEALDLQRMLEGGLISWPFPQVFLGSRYCLVCFRSSVYIVSNYYAGDTMYLMLHPILLDENNDPLLDENDDPLTANAMPYLNVQAGDRWNFTDFGEYFILTNGVTFIHADFETDPGFVRLSTAKPANVPLCGSYCNFKGQLIGCDVKDRVYVALPDTTTWQGQLVTWQDPLAIWQSAEYEDVPWHDCGENSIVWSKIGRTDMTPGVSMESGFKNIVEWYGKMLRVMRLEDRVICYGDNGILSMIPAGQTFGWKEISTIGLLSRYAVGGDTKSHIFIDSKHTLWRINNNYTLSELGYEEFMRQLDKDTILISRDSKREEFYISDGSKTFLLTNYGLSEYPRHPTTIIALDDGIFAVAEDLSAISEGRAETTLIDTVTRGLKTIVAIEVGAEYDDDIFVAVRWRTKIKEALRLSKWQKVNQEGIVYPKITGTEFGVAIKVADPANFKLDYINIRMNLTDRRSVRGVLDANETQG